MKKNRTIFAVLACLLVLSMKSVGQFRLEDRWPSLRFANPVDVQAPDDGSNRLFVVEQNGRIQVFPAVNGTAASTTFLNLTGTLATGGELGLLGLAFHPNYATNRYFFVNYTMNNPLRTVIARFTASPTDPNAADPASRKIILEFNQPFSNHNGGSLFFGNDGFLYIASGDGGSGNDPQNNAQNRTNLLGKILRIDVNVPDNQAYAIPPSNPYASDPNPAIRKEIFAFGLRNPWKTTIDRVTGRIWAADVGQNSREEINLIESGKNYGWRLMEGDICTPGINNGVCDTTGLTLPVFSYSHSVGRSITGGYVYRGSEMQPLVGAYIYGDFVEQEVWALKETAPGVFQNESVLSAGVSISSFAVDRNGEMYVVARSSTQGRLLQIRCGDPAPAITGNSASVCGGDSVVLEGPANASGYLWSNGHTGRRLVIRQSGRYFLRTINAQGCLSDSSRNVVVEVFPKPATPVISGPSTACEGQSLTLSGPEGLPFYGWNTGVNAASIEVNASGRYYLVVLNELGCRSDTAFKTVSFFPVPATPVLAVSGASISISNYASGQVQWFRNGILIAGQSGPSVPFSAFGVYAAVVSLSPACASDTGTLAVNGPLSAPTVSPAGGTFDLPQTLTLTSSTPGAAIYYTTNGNVPVVGTGFTRLYTAPFVVNQTTTVRAIAVVPFSGSPVRVANYTIVNPTVVNTPDIRPRTGTYSTLQTVTLTCATPGAAIYYTTNGNVPRLDVPNGFTRLYTGPFPVFQTTTVRAIAIKAGSANSPVGVSFLTFPQPAVVGPVVFSPGPGTFSAPLAVSMSTTPADAQIWYTTNGNIPRVDVPNFFTRLYSTPVNISSNTFFRAFGVRTGFANGPVAQATYTLAAGRTAVDDGTEPRDLEPVNEGDVVLYPNPTSGKVKLRRDDSGKARLWVVNPVGKILKESGWEDQNLELDLTTLPAGIYLVLVETASGRKEFRISKY